MKGIVKGGKNDGVAVELTGTALETEVISGKTFYRDDPEVKLTGMVTERVGAGVILTPSTSDQAVPEGRYGGAQADGKVVGDADLIAENIRLGANIFGVEGSFDGGAPTLDGTALITDVVVGKTFYKDDPFTKLTGTHECSSDCKQYYFLAPAVDRGPLNKFTAPTMLVEGVV